MIVIFFSFYLVFILISIFGREVFVIKSRLRASLFRLLGLFNNLWNLNLVRFLLSISIFLLIFTNLLGNIPIVAIGSIFYSVILSVRLLFWIPLIVCIFFRQLDSFIAHLLPYGAPEGLALILPIIEGFSQIIRPFTLTIRLRTNLSAGHIILYMFSYFRILSIAISPILFIAIRILFVLELFISILQGYIFISLLHLYFIETV